ncbi:hypothetical protein FA10DRAFT_267963 [Acaromyces ingoldii]|uniref:FAM192A/Fyv6 N-terminal domain-containing protein n=1 Tax=Acaromyces ingoldii TaxID=215250 RepID=A0A316YKQ7_9BASI|nr:hypothetical protein FA10DRAFT_267963 [Acaromyces ingoldii]PWN89394.1 hypothetical protein FA10DRAFT_267963 [Acaromyces ingoldii]
MDPTKPSSSVSSRFVSQTELEEAQKRRKEEIRATYARIGQEPPPEEEAEAPYDPRSLYERIQANKDAKQEAFEAQTKLSAQFRGIDDAESAFLEQVAREKRDEARKKDEEVRRELEEYRKVIREKEEEDERKRLAVAEAAAKKKKDEEAAAAAAPTASAGQPASSKAKGKRKREGLLGIVRKKPATEAAQAKEQAAPEKGQGSPKAGALAESKDKASASKEQQQTKEVTNGEAEGS